MSVSSYELYHAIVIFLNYSQLGNVQHNTLTDHLNVIPQCLIVFFPVFLPQNCQQIQFFIYLLSINMSYLFSFFDIFNLVEHK